MNGFQQEWPLRPVSFKRRLCGGLLNNVTSGLPLVMSRSGARRDPPRVFQLGPCLDRRSDGRVEPALAPLGGTFARPSRKSNTKVLSLGQAPHNEMRLSCATGRPQSRRPFPLSGGRPGATASSAG